MTNADELLPCPFCGGEANVGGTNDTDFAYCTKCDATIVTEIGKAETAWNTRAESPELSAARREVEELRAWIRKRGHTQECLYIQSTTDFCICGLVNILKKKKGTSQ